MNRIIENVVIEKTGAVFSTLFDASVSAGPAYPLELPDIKHWDISGVVGVTGDCFGMMAIRLNYDLASTLMERSRIHLPGDPQGQRLMSDMIGEIINVISGNVLSELVADDFRLSIPVIIQGDMHEISWPKKTAVTAFPFEILSFNVEVQAGLSCGRFKEREA